MKKFKVIRDGKETNSWKEDFAGADYYEPGFGKPERWVREFDEDISGALETRTVLSDMGESITEYRLPAEYTVITEDITAQIAQNEINKDAQAYLNATDWYIIREMDEGTPCPPDIKLLRAEARAKINK